MEENGIYVRQNNYGRRYLEYDICIIPIKVKVDTMTINVRKTSDYELWTYTFFDLTSDLPWNPEKSMNQNYLPKNIIIYDPNRIFLDEYRKLKPKNRICLSRDFSMSNWYKFNK